jgi:hypothetical protein
VGKQHDQARLALPLLLAGRDELVHDHLRPVGKIAKLRFPEHQRIGILLHDAARSGRVSQSMTKHKQTPRHLAREYQGEAQLVAQDGILGKGGVVHKHGRLRRVDVSEGLVGLAGLPVVQDRMPGAEQRSQETPGGGGGRTQSGNLICWVIIKEYKEYKE